MEKSTVSALIVALGMILSAGIRVWALKRKRDSGNGRRVASSEEDE